MPGYYDQDFDPWVRGIRNIGTMIMEMPRLRAEQAMRQQTADQNARLTSARVSAENAQAGKLTAETTALQEEGAGDKRLGSALRRVQANPTDPAALGDVFQEYGRFFKKNPQEAAQGLGTLLNEFDAMKRGDRVQMFSAASGKTVGPNEVVGTGADARGNIVANRGQTVADAMGDKLLTGQPVPTVLAPGRVAIAPEGGPEFAEVGKGVPLPPKSAGADVTRARLISQALLASNKDKLGNVVVTNVPALVGQYDKMAGAPEGAGDGQGDELVPVINPAGKPVRIRRAQLQQALAQGYKQR